MDKNSRETCNCTQGTLLRSPKYVFDLKSIILAFLENPMMYPYGPYAVITCNTLHFQPRFRYSVFQVGVSCNIHVKVPLQVLPYLRRSMDNGWKNTRDKFPT